MVNSLPPPPQPLPDSLLGESWQFVALPAQDIWPYFGDRPMRYQSMPEHLSPLQLGLAADLPIPGVVIYGGRQCRQIGQWLAEQQPTSLLYIAEDPQQSGGLVLHTQTGDRWVMVTFKDGEMATAAGVFSQRQQKAKGLHFLWLQPDDSGVTTTGFWLLGKQKYDPMLKKF
ncbi:DUF1092 family protein [Synechocystis salina LEGE 06155]|nr:DUF1092 family protein [Synechocystis salina LEGE 06155]